MVENTLNGLMERSAAAYQWTNRVLGYPPDFNRQDLGVSTAHSIGAGRIIED